jgi:hypothetical protein
MEAQGEFEMTELQSDQHVNLIDNHTVAKEKKIFLSNGQGRLQNVQKVEGSRKEGL